VSATTAPASATAPKPSPPPSRPRRLLSSASLLTVAVGAAVFLVAYDNGGYGLPTRSIAAIAVWWAIILGVGLGLVPLARIPRVALVTGALLAGFAAWTLASTVWAPSAEAAFNEFNRVTLYLAVFTLAVLAGTRANAPRWADGLGLGIVATGFVSLATRLFPNLLETHDLGTFLPSAYARLSFPVGYWNGLAILVGIAFPLCLRRALAGGTPLTRSVALVPLPALVAVIYLTSSRGGVAAAAAGMLVFLVATDRRWAALGALLAAGIASALAITVLLRRDELVDGPLTSAAAVDQGRSAAVLLVGCCLLGGVLFLLGERTFGGRFRPSPVAGRVAAAVVVLVAAGAVLLAHPVQRFETFKAVPTQSSTTSPDFVRSHLLSGNGSGRWQFWTTAVDEFRSEPVVGKGAGSYESWWAQHGSFSYFLRNAHSLYLETLGELGLVGILLLGLAFLAGLDAAVRRIGWAEADERTTVAALTATFVAFALGAAIDWVWQLSALGIIGIAGLGLLVGPATATRSWAAVAVSPPQRPVQSLRFAGGAAMVVAAWILICAQAIPWLAGVKISDSEAAARRGDIGAALKDALDAKRMQPWASSPYHQLALVEEEAGDLARARQWLAKAIDRNDSDWRLWLASARIETESGRIRAARRSLARAAALNPRSPLFASVAPRDD
jgi:O-antigen ligase/polysaccharide polymerase Wzy-like membrane protein